MIDISETWQGQRQQGGGFGQGRGRGGFFHRFMESQMGESNQFLFFETIYLDPELMQCIHNCWQNSHRDHGSGCFASLSKLSSSKNFLRCGVKRHEPGMWMQQMQECRGEFQEKQERICQCLTNMGAA